MICLTLAGVLAGCQDRPAAVTPSTPAVSAPEAQKAAPGPDAWVGTWNGPEGTFLKVAGGGGAYDITVQNLDGPRTFKGTAVGDGIEFERDGTKESVHASGGVETGMKWLAEKKDCLTVRNGEGYCRD